MRQTSFLVATLATLLVSSWFLTQGQAKETQEETAESPAPKLAPLEEEDSDFVELFPYMTELSHLTHKLALATKAKNTKLAEFYLYESILHLEVIQNDVPEYRGQPIALFIDRMAHPAYEEMKTNLQEEEPDFELLTKNFQSVVQSCNACHAATDHAFLKVTDGFDVNPFNQSFQP